jgi:hypothetical protein
MLRVLYTCQGPMNEDHVAGDKVRHTWNGKGQKEQNDVLGILGVAVPYPLDLPWLCAQYE